jgi:hypothetical protein
LLHTVWVSEILPSMHMLTPVLALIGWTLLMGVWMFATRLPAMGAAGIDPKRLKRPDELNVLPVAVCQVADNYRHLHEQPTLFYALVLYSHLVGVADPLNVGLAWGYVGLRVVHSLVQATFNFVPVRFAVFSASMLVLAAMAARNALALMG